MLGVGLATVATRHVGVLSLLVLRQTVSLPKSCRPTSALCPSTSWSFLPARRASRYLPGGDMGQSGSRGKRSYEPNKGSVPAGKSTPSASPTRVEHGKFSNSASNPATTPAASSAPASPAASTDTSAASTDDMVEGVVCKESDVAENEMKVFDLGSDGGKVLIVKQNGQFSALGTKCSHYGAPLVNGALGEGRIRCQWHGACFNITTGDIEDFPGMDSLPCYKVTVVDGEVRVAANKTVLKANKRVRGTQARDPSNETTFVVVGGGPSGAKCVETLRQEGFTGRVVLVSSEPHLPYDRIKLSKALNMEVQKIALRPRQFYDERNIELLLSTQLTGLDHTQKNITLSNGDHLKYDKLFLATGSVPRRIEAPGSHLGNIFVLRTVDDANAISSALSKDKRVVVLGSSFIGLEAASIIKDQVHSVDIVAIEKVPFEIILGADIGKGIQTLFEEKGVTFHLEESIVEFRGEDGRLKEVVLKGGDVLPADICLIGIGVMPSTGYLSQQPGVTLQRNGSVPVNQYLETELAGVYAGGDIAYAPILSKLGTDDKASIGHWGLATYHGHTAALNMLGKQTPLNTVPFFWTVLFGKSFRYTGFAVNFEEVEIHGDVSGLKFVALLVVNGIVRAVTTINRDPVAAQFAELLHQGNKLTKQEAKTLLKL